VSLFQFCVRVCSLSELVV